MKRTAFYSALFVISALAMLTWRLWPELTRPTHLDPAFQIPSPFELASLPAAKRFDFPPGSEQGALAYNAQRFTENHHLGDDLNSIGREDSDLGDPIYAVADGRVLLARDGGSGLGKHRHCVACLHREWRAKIRAVVLRECRNNARAGWR